MCVKEFLGYNCGHCSTPYLRQCPITSSNPTFPVCKFPAERPIFTNENCHPCARVLWNIKVLAEEEAHHERHRRGDCDCPTIFDSEERERRLRPRSGKGKGKGKESIRDGENMDVTRQEDASNGHGENLDMADHEGGGNFGYEAQYTSEESATTHDYTNASAGQGTDQQGWAPPGPLGATYEEYVGFYVAKKSNRADLEHVEQGRGFPHGGFVPQEVLWSGQLAMNQPGCGMKWYPEQNAYLPVLSPLSTAPIPAHLPALTAPQAEPSVYDYVPKVWQSKALSEPNGSSAHHFSPRMPTIGIEATEIAGDVGSTYESPVVVSSVVVNTMAK